MKIDFLMAENSTQEGGYFGWRRGVNCSKISRAWWLGKNIFRVVSTAGAVVYELRPLHFTTNEGMVPPEPMPAPEEKAEEVEQ